MGKLYVLELEYSGVHPFVMEPRSRLPQDGWVRKKSEDGKPVVDWEAFQKLRNTCEVCSQKDTVPHYLGIPLSCSESDGEGVTLEVRHPELDGGKITLGAS